MSERRDAKMAALCEDLAALVDAWTVEELDDANGQPHACAWHRAAVREACATDLAALLMLHSSTSTTS